MSGAADRPGRGPVMLAALGAFALAALVLPAAPGMGDSAELTLALALAGIPHPTGYPFYVLSGHLFVTAAHALGASWVVAANLWSALGAAVAAGAAARVVQHLVAALDDAERRAGRAPAPAVARATAIAFPLLALILNPVWIATATVAEVYSWNNAWLAVASAFALGRLRALGAVAPLGAKSGVPATPAAVRGRAADDLRVAVWWGVLCGLCGTHHVTSLLFVVPLSVALIAAQVAAGRWRIALALAAVGAALVPLACYAWIPWRAAHPAAFQWPVGPSLRALWLHVRGAAYASYVGHFAPGAADWSLIRRGVLPWLLPGMGLGVVIALRSASRAARWGMLALLAGAALQVGFITSYGVDDPAMYFLPTLLPGLLAAIPALLWLARRRTPLAVPALALVPVLALGTWSVPRALRERERLAEVDAGFRATWRTIPFENGIVLWRDDHYHRFKLLQILEGQRPDLYVESPDMLIWPARRRAFERRFGFDAFEGMTLRTAEDLNHVGVNIRRHSKVPVLILPEYHEPARGGP